MSTAAKLTGRRIHYLSEQIKTYYDSNDVPTHCEFKGAIVPLKLRRGFISTDPFLSTVEAYWGTYKYFKKENASNIPDEFYYLAFNKLSDIVLVLTWKEKSVQQCYAVEAVQGV